MRLALGTVQFGLNYGVSNKFGQVKISEIKKIINIAEMHKIDTLDTAIIYGNSERILGEVGIKKFNVITKIPSLPKDRIDINLWVNQHINSSLKKLKLNSISGLLLHRSSDFLETPQKHLFDSLNDLKNKGVVKKVGVSIYDPCELDALEANGIVIDIVQAPFNILDRRLESTGWLDKLNNNGVEIHTRSAFLQGLLLQTKEERNPYFNKWSYFFKIFDEWINDTKLSRLDASINFSNSYENINKILVGVQSSIQLSQIVTSISQDFQLLTPKELQIDDPMLINPANWKL